jgi:hypothetical protein
MKTELNSPRDASDFERCSRNSGGIGWHSIVNHKSSVASNGGSVTVCLWRVVLLAPNERDLCWGASLVQRTNSQSSCYPDAVPTVLRWHGSKWGSGSSRSLAGPLRQRCGKKIVKRAGELIVRFHAD